MAKLYLIGCFVIALMVPHVSAESVGTAFEVIFQIGFVLAGLCGFKAFSL